MLYLHVPLLLQSGALQGLLSVRCACTPSRQHMAASLLVCCRWLVLDGPLQGVWPRLLSDLLHSSAKPKVCPQVAAACQSHASGAPGTKPELMLCTDPEFEAGWPRIGQAIRCNPQCLWHMTFADARRPVKDAGVLSHQSQASLPGLA